MSFPTADDVASLSHFMRLKEIEGLVIAARPGLSGLTGIVGPTLALTIELPSSRTGAHNRVVLASGRGGHPHWLIVGSRSFDLVNFVWGFDTPDTQLRDALLATLDGCLARSEIASPWRWAEPTQSTVVRVADGLTAAGLSVDGVVSSNRFIPDVIEGVGRPHWVPPDFGDALRIKMRLGTGTLARKATLGWVFDVNNHVVTRRVDLARYVTGTASTTPGIVTDDADLLVQAAMRAANDAELAPVEGGVSPSAIGNEPLSLEAAAESWLRELGYPGVQTRMRRGPGVSGPFFVVTSTKRCGLLAVKTAFADAASERKSLVMFAEGGYTRDALSWANRASVALYQIDSRSQAIWPSSALATEHVPRVI